MTPHRGKIVVTLAALAALAGCGGSKSDSSSMLLMSQAPSSSSAAPSPTSATSSASSASSAPSGGATSTGGATPSEATSASGAASDGQGTTEQGTDGKSRGKNGTGSTGSTDSGYTGASVAVPKATAVGISIPAIGLKHSLTRGGLTGGVLSPPSGVIQQFTGYGRVSPGQTGISVLAGHVTWNGPDVFYRLPSVPVGSKVSIAYADGTHKDFVVTSKASVDKMQLQNDARVWGGSSSPVIALVTCDSNSSWMNGQHHTNNYVVWARSV